MKLLLLVALTAFAAKECIANEGPEEESVELASPLKELLRVERSIHFDDTIAQFESGLASITDSAEDGTPKATPRRAERSPCKKGKKGKKGGWGKKKWGKKWGK